MRWLVTIAQCIVGLWSHPHAMPSVRRFVVELINKGIANPVIIGRKSHRDITIDEQLIHFSTDTGALLLDGMGDGTWLDQQ